MSHRLIRTSPCSAFGQVHLAPLPAGSIPAGSILAASPSISGVPVPSIPDHQVCVSGFLASKFKLWTPEQGLGTSASTSSSGFLVSELVPLLPTLLRASPCSPLRGFGHVAPLPAGSIPAFLIHELFPSWVSGFQIQQSVGPISFPLVSKLNLEMPLLRQLHCLR
jgi:hypothetical protein